MDDEFEEMERLAKILVRETWRFNVCLLRALTRRAGAEEAADRLVNVCSTMLTSTPRRSSSHTYNITVRIN